MPKVEARAQVLRGEALLAIDRRDDAEETVAAAARIAQEITYPRALWQALGAARGRGAPARTVGRRGASRRADAWP